MGRVIAPEYVAARGVLLDALAALESHLDAVVLVGAQAVYLRAGAADLAVAPTTTDADLALAPARLADEPLLAEAMRGAGFLPGANPGTWCGRGGVAVDLMVPEALGGTGGRRGARLPVHGNRVARRTAGLEAAVVDNEFQEVAALSDGDTRSFPTRVAGSAALLVSKIVKIDERREQPGRLKPKDGLDVLRLLRASTASDLAGRLSLLAADDLAGPSTRQVLAVLRAERGARHGRGVIAELAATAAAGLDDPDVVADSVVALIDELLDAYDHDG